MDHERDNYIIYDSIGWLRVMQHKKGRGSKFMLYWQGIDQEAMSLSTQTDKTDPRDVQVEALELLLEDRREHGKEAKKRRQLP